MTEKEWNLSDERKKFKKNLDYALGKFNWGNSALDADAILILNEWKIMLDNQDDEFIKRERKIIDKAHFEDWSLTKTFKELDKLIGKK